MILAHIHCTPFTRNGTSTLRLDGAQPVPVSVCVCLVFTVLAHSALNYNNNNVDMLCCAAYAQPLNIIKTIMKRSKFLCEIGLNAGKECCKRWRPHRISVRNNRMNCIKWPHNSIPIHFTHKHRQLDRHNINANDSTRRKIKMKTIHRTMCNYTS